MGDFFVIQLSQHGYDSDYSSTIEKRFLYPFALIISVFVRNLCGFCADSKIHRKQKVQKNTKNRRILSDSAVFMVDDTGLEPVTLRTSSGCSYQLS